jgi:malonate-semialdehyde dehydrogenase (acetylating)/methylmalonate-semialdehyde dehydrogenase
MSHPAAVIRRPAPIPAMLAPLSMDEPCERSADRASVAPIQRPRDQIGEPVPTLPILLYGRPDPFREGSMRIVDNFIGGQHRASASTRLGDIFNPATGQVQAQVRLSAPSELDEAVANAQAAQPAWAAMNPQRRARVMFNLKALIEQHMDELAELLSVEHGKVHSDAKGDIQRGLDVVEFACGVPHLLKGEYTEGAGPGIDVYSLRQPIGIAAGITPFNFPAMIPMWMFAPAIACGNAFILKPSERNPSVPVRLAELAMEAGLPAGILNVVHGDKQVVDAILDHPAIKAVSFVGSSDIAQYVYGRGASNGKRMQCMGGAKNHGIVMPDADLDQAVADILGAAYGSAGERCMALPVVVPVGEQTAVALRAKLEAGIAGLRVGVPSDPDAHYGPVVSAAHKARIENYIQMAPQMKSYQEEIFGPVLQMVRAETFEEAISYPTRHQYGNGVALFTRNGDFARRFCANVEVGMVGINVPIPVPVSYHSFGGWKRSGFGDMNQYGMDGVRFYTRVKTVTQRWPSGGAVLDQSFVIPTMG